MARSDRSLQAVGAYLARLEPDLYGTRFTRKRIAQEIRIHLEEAVTAELERGLSPEEAQSEAIKRFGSPRVVINSWADSKGIGMVTNFTRFGGLAGIIGAIGLVGTFIYADISWSFSIGWFAEIALGFGTLLAMGMLAVYMRLRGKLGRYARIGFQLIAAGLVVGFGSSMLWFVPGGVVGITMLITGAGLYLVGALRADVLPRLPLRLWTAGVVLSAIIGMGGSLIGVDTGYVASGLGYWAFITGWVMLGSHLWSERPQADSSSFPLTT